jgi:hypothetical protein
MSRFVLLSAISVLGIAIIYLDKKCLLLKDTSTAGRRPYSWARVQSAWWTVIVLASMAGIMITKGIPTLDVSTDRKSVV